MGTPDRDELLDRIRRGQRVLDDLFRKTLTSPVPLLGEIEAELLVLEGSAPEGVPR